MTLRDFFFWAAIAVIGPVALLLSHCAARGASMDYCRLYAREYVVSLVRGLEEVDRRTATIDVITHTLRQSYARCLNSEDEPQVLLEDDDAWARRIHDLLSQETSPQDEAEATPSPPPAAAEPEVKVKAKESFNEWCARNYRSFDPRSGTVKKWGSRRRVRCPGP
jgi:hypothetical protein